MNVSLRDAKSDLARRTQRGMHNLIANLILWMAFAGMALFLDGASERALAYVVGAATLWMLALVIGRMLNLDLFARGNPLSVLYILLCGLQFPTIPVLIGAYIAAPETVPWYLGVLAGVQFLLFAWLYDSSAYLFCALGTIEVASLIGWLAPSLSFTYLATPLAIIAVLLISTTFLLRENLTASSAKPNRSTVS